MECTEPQWYELCIIYNEIYETIDKKELKKLIKEVEDGKG